MVRRGNSIRFPVSVRSPKGGGVSLSPGGGRTRERNSDGDSAGNEFSYYDCTLVGRITPIAPFLRSGKGLRSLRVRAMIK